MDDVVNFMLYCGGEFAGDRGRLLDMIEGEEWMAEWRIEGEGRVVVLI